MDNLEFEKEISQTSIEEFEKNLSNFFDFNGDINGTAYLNWRFDNSKVITSQMCEMGKAYYETALNLLDTCLENNSDKKADSWIFPILFHTVHGIEVYLKGFNSQIKTLELLSKKQKYEVFGIEGTHNILQLLQTALSRFDKYTRDNKYLTSQEEVKKIRKKINFIKKFIKILYENTDDMTFARYPVTSKKELQFYNNDSDYATYNNITIDLHIYKIWLCKIFSILDEITGFCEYKIEEQMEYLVEIQNYNYE